VLPASGRTPDRGVQRGGGDDSAYAATFGRTKGNIAIQVAIGELFVHSWDLAKATNQMFTDEGIADALLASDWLALCDYVRTDSSAPFAAMVPSDGDAPLVDQLVAFLGRDPHFKPH
jgi:hypothetical protein